MTLETILYKFNPWWEGEYSSHLIPWEKYNRQLEEFRGYRDQEHCHGIQG